MSLLTSAALLLAMLMPPVLQHAHAAGDTPHSHATVGHDHHGDAADHQHSDNSHRYTGRAAPIAHWHVSLLFFDFSLPQRDDVDSDSDSQPQLLPAATCGLPTQTVALDSPWFLDAAVVAEPGELPDVEVPAIGARPQARNLLCDTARRARSGVLLI